MIFDVKNYGAVADGVTLNTQAIQSAIDACVAAGGGRVLLEGGPFLSGAIRLGDNVELYIAAGATLLGSTDCNDYPEYENLKHVSREWLPRVQSACFIFADECENIAICGQGKINCNGDQFVRYHGELGWKYRRINAPTPPRAIFLTGCKNVRVENVTIENLPAGWACWVHDCDFVNFDKVNIFANVDYPNNDGIHINCSRNVTVSNCNIVCGDDCVIVRANSSSLKENKPCERVCVTNCNLTSYSAGIRIAWVNDGTIKNCVFSNLVMTDTTIGISLFIPYLKRPESTDVGREATLVENLSFDNIVMDKIVSNPIKIDIDENSDVRVAAIRNLQFSNIRARSIEFPMFKGRAETHLENIRFSNCEFEMIDGSEFPNRFAHGAPTWNDGEFHAPVVRYVDGLKFDATEFKVK
ncbi:MAG: right-handed parallel beta-helix repeat-containing protein [Clostridia bacterium]|nr:right-handed parallel beta-helix repeat-containing protein [Clostridia bacterium]